jgi:hypothetical protein
MELPSLYKDSQESQLLVNLPDEKPKALPTRVQEDCVHWSHSNSLDTGLRCYCMGPLSPTRHRHLGTRTEKGCKIYLGRFQNEGGRMRYQDAAKRRTYSASWSPTYAMPNTSNRQPICFIHNIFIKSILMASCSVENKITQNVIEISSLITFWRPKSKENSVKFVHIFSKNAKICFDLISFLFLEINKIFAAELWPEIQMRFSDQILFLIYPTWPSQWGVGVTHLSLYQTPQIVHIPTI